jgi:AraC-like DNA-binding protein
MYDLLNILDDLIMEYFSGVNFVNWGESPRYGSSLDTIFSGYYGIQYTHSGSFYCSVGDNPFQTVYGASAFVSYPGKRFRYGAESGGVRHHLFVCFNGERVDDYISRGLLRLEERNPLISIKKFDCFYADMRELHRCLNLQPRKYDYAVHLLEGLLLQLNSEQQQEYVAGNSQAGDFRKLAEELNEKPEMDWDFYREAAAMNLSYVHFRRLFHRYLGCPPGQFLQRCRLNHAAVRLCSSDEPISAIAELYGFCDCHYFSRLFKRQFILPPATYRNEFKGISG